jgi:hypothetical protein
MMFLGIKLWIFPLLPESGIKSSRKLLILADPDPLPLKYEPPPRPIKNWRVRRLVFRGETGLFPEAYVQEIFDEDTPPPALAPPPLPQVYGTYLSWLSSLGTVPTWCPLLWSQFLNFGQCCGYGPVLNRIRIQPLSSQQIPYQIRILILLSKIYQPICSTSAGLYRYRILRIHLRNVTIK